MLEFNYRMEYVPRKIMLGDCSMFPVGEDMDEIDDTDNFIVANVKVVIGGRVYHENGISGPLWWQLQEDNLLRYPTVKHAIPRKVARNKRETSRWLKED
ncbi:hypothetical protein NDU88_002201 [Pleurodeles waltl]|uniref:Uncharacterized protein n=1 Tax=Pleurodeles waltl TaxID=8319 RepID=A0AAV7P7M1_PLEWA|nr:hypothetical protein NDU88_002201 [Pleurodeles waltl]